MIFGGLGGKGDLVGVNDCVLAEEFSLGESFSKWFEAVE